MENAPPQRKGLPIMEWVVGILCVLILAGLWLPSINSPPTKARLTTALSNGKQIHQAAYKMILDNEAEANPALGWPGDLAQSSVHPISSVGDYVERLVQYNYISRENLGKLFTGPNVPAYSGSGPFDGRNSVFNFYKIRTEDLDEALFLATKNFNYGAALDPKKAYGEKGAVIVRKGGDAQSLSAGQAMNPKVGVMPGGTLEKPGKQDGNILKD